MPLEGGKKTSFLALTKWFTFQGREDPVFGSRISHLAGSSSSSWLPASRVKAKAARPNANAPGPAAPSTRPGPASPRLSSNRCRKGGVQEIPASLRTQRRRRRANARPKGAGISSAARDSLRSPVRANGESRMRTAMRWGKGEWGEGRTEGAGSRSPRGHWRRMRLEGAQSQTRLAATGLKKETSESESAKEI